MLSPEWLRSNFETRGHLPLGAAFDEVLAELRRLSGGEFCDDLCLLGMEVKTS
jgi:hypothetical protein